jgi:hypothetical protein
MNTAFSSPGITLAGKIFSESGPDSSVAVLRARRLRGTGEIKQNDPKTFGPAPLFHLLITTILGGYGSRARSELDPPLGAPS